MVLGEKAEFLHLPARGEPGIDQPDARRAGVLQCPTVESVEIGQRRLESIDAVIAALDFLIEARAPRAEGRAACRLNSHANAAIVGVNPAIAIADAILLRNASVVHPAPRFAERESALGMRTGDALGIIGKASLRGSGRLIMPIDVAGKRVIRQGIPGCVLHMQPQVIQCTEHGSDAPVFTKLDAGLRQ